MNLSYFISKRINSSEKRSFSAIIYKIAVASIALGIAIMIIAFLILSGFQETIVDKIYGFGSHLQVTKYTLGSSFEDEPINQYTEFYKRYDEIGFVEHVQSFAHKAALIKTREEVEGVVIKGVSSNFDQENFSNYLKRGRFINFSDSGYSKEIVVSEFMANRLRLELGEEVFAYFIQNPPRIRKLEVVGIYESGLEDFDQKLLFSDIGLIQRLNNWGDTLVGGYEVFLKKPLNVDYAHEELYRYIDYDLYIQKISNIYIQIFDWLGLLERNVYIFLGLILFVACFNMISILLILIMERTQMIGVLKALGATNQQVRKVFLYNGMLIVSKGMAIGNGIGLGICALQYFFEIIPLDQQTYYMEYVPIQWNVVAIVLINIFSFILVTAALLIPTLLIARVNPIKAIRFD
ncbi:MAG: FtsX-like permease family protein [Bacteroidota bacterium]